MTRIGRWRPCTTSRPFAFSSPRLPASAKSWFGASMSIPPAVVPAAGAVGTPDPPSLRGLTPVARLCPAVGGGVVRRFGIHPRASDAARDGAAGGALDPLPERSAGLEIVHQELGGRKGILAMRCGRHHQPDVLAWRDPPIAMDHGDAQEGPAALGRLDVARDLGLRHAGIVLERERRDRLAVLVAAADAGEGDDRANVIAPARERGGLGGGVERLLLQADRHITGSENAWARRCSAHVERHAL